MVVFRVIMLCALPVLIGLTVWQRLRGRVGPHALAQRLGVVPTAHGPSFWLHGASNGELTSAHWVLQRLLAARPGVQVLVTANTGTAVAMVAGWGLPGVVAALAPFDTVGSVGRVLRHWQPAALIVIENELWPARLAALRAAGIPVALIGARLSARSAARWTSFAPALMRQGLSGIAYASAQDAGSGARLVALGLPPDRLGPVVMLKALAPAAGPDPLPQSMPQNGPQNGPQNAPQTVPRDRVLLAASTHDGEETLILNAFQQSRARFDLLILAPRHPRRGNAVAADITARGLEFGRRSNGDSPQAGVPVFLADTMGEMALWYAMAGVTVIGGSFADRGGHTPYEPAAYGSAILHGPSTTNFAEVFAALNRAGAAMAVSDEPDLIRALTTDPADMAAMARAAPAVLTPVDGREDLIAALIALVDQTGAP